MMYMMMLYDDDDDDDDEYDKDGHDDDDDDHDDDEWINTCFGNNTSGIYNIFEIYIRLLLKWSELIDNIISIIIIISICTSIFIIIISIWRITTMYTDQLPPSMLSSLILVMSSSCSIVDQLGMMLLTPILLSNVAQIIILSSASAS